MILDVVEAISIFLAVVGYLTGVTVAAVTIRRHALELNCLKLNAPDKHSYSYANGDDHLWCSTLTGHWFFPLIASILLPATLVPLLVLKHMHREEISQKRIKRMERELQIDS